MAVSKSKHFAGVQGDTSWIFASDATLTALNSPLKRPSTFSPNEASHGLLLKAYVLIVVTEVGISTDVSLFAWNARRLICVSVSGSVSDEIWLFLKA